MTDMKSEIFKQLTRCCETELQNVYWGTNISRPNIKGVQCLNVARIIVPISGTKEISFTNENLDSYHVLIPGDAVFIPPFSWTMPYWTTCHEMISVVFPKDHIRIIYINFDENKPKKLPPTPELIYNIKYPQDNLLPSLLYILNKIAGMKKRNDRLGNSFITSLLIYITNSVKCETDNASIRKSFAVWSKISQYIGDNYLRSLSRSDIAEKFCIEETYLSTLCKKYSGKSLKEYINNLKLEYSCNLLINTNYTLDEISCICGYNYTSYYLRVFKNTYGTTPSQYRADNILRLEDLPR